MNKIDEMIRELCPEGVKRVKLGEVAALSRGKVISKDYLREHEGSYPVYSSQTTNKGIMGCIDSYAYDGEYLTWTTDGAYAGTVFRRKGQFSITNVCGLIDIIDKKTLSLDFLYYWLSITAKKNVSEGMGNAKLMSNVMEKIEIPLPPLAIQQEIVSILDSFSSLQSKLEEELAVRQKQMEFYREKLLTFDKDDNSVKWMKLGEVGDVCMCRRILKQQTSTDGEIPFYKIGTFGKLADAYISDELYREYKEKYKFPKKGEILISAAGTIGRTVVYDGEPAYFQDSNIVWISNDEKNVYNTFLSYVYSVAKWDVDNGGVVARLYNSNISRTIIPVPPLSRQQEIVSTLDTMSSLIDKLKEEIELRKKQYEYYREALLSF